jgi:hypothetical protein
MKTVSAFALLLAGLFVATAPAIAQHATPSGHAAKKMHAKKAHAVKKEADDEDDDGPEPDITGQLSTDYQCELGNKLTIYRHKEDDQHIALRWHKRLHQMTRVQTTTGANRFESPKKGLVWIGIPAKSMLLDAKRGHQLANECRSSEQEAAQKVADQRH